MNERRADARAGGRARGRVAGDGEAVGAEGAGARVRGALDARRGSPMCGSWRGCARAGTRSSRSSRPATAASSRSGRSRACSSRRRRATRSGSRARGGPGAGADRTDLRRAGPELALAGRALRRRPADDAATPRRFSTRGFPLPAFLQLAARLRAGDRPDRRRRGAAVPPVRARAADARGRARGGDRRGDGGADARGAAVRGAVHELPARALPGALRRAGRDRPHGVRPRRRARPPRRGACGWRSRSPTSPAIRG